MQREREREKEKERGRKIERGKATNYMKITKLQLDRCTKRYFLQKAHRILFRASKKAFEKYSVPATSLE
jgi:hypothetical protein